jgi:uncharacterized membrane protein YbhN (UPF0104 family)
LPDVAVPPGGASEHAPDPKHVLIAGRALHAGRKELLKHALKLFGYIVFAYLLLRLVPTLKQAVHSLQRVSWQWVVGAIALEVLSEFGYVMSWRAIVDPEGLLERDGRGARTATRAAWAQLGGGLVLPGGALTSIGVGAWILHHFGMPGQTIAERQFNLSFLNTALDALALIVFGLGLAIFGGEHNPLLTVAPAVVAAFGIVAVLLISRRATTYAERLEPKHQKVAVSITSVANAVESTYRLLFHREGFKAVFGAIAYLGFDSFVLWTAFIAIHAHPLPSYPIVLMAYIIGALGGSIPLPAGIGAVGGIAGMLILYGVGHQAAVAAVVLYGAVGLIVPLTGGSIAYLILRREFGPIKGAGDASDDEAVAPGSTPPGHRA